MSRASKFGHATSSEVTADVGAAIAVDGAPQQALVLCDRLTARMHGERGLARLQRLREPLHFKVAEDAAGERAPVIGLQLYCAAQAGSRCWS